MKTIILLSIFFITHISLAKDFFPENVRVRLQKNLTQYSLSGFSVAISGVTCNYKTVSLPKFENVNIKTVKLNGKYLWQIDSRIINNPIIQMSGYNLTHQASVLPSRLVFSLNKTTGEFDLIGVVAMDEYILGVLQGEMPITWPEEALKAQAVAARSYVKAVIKERKNNLFHVESSVMDQVFRMSEHSDEKLLKLKQIVKETNNIYLTKDKENIFKAYFHSDCGGHTRTAKSVWGYGDDGGTASDPWCPLNPKANWEFSLNKAEMLNKISDFLLEPITFNQLKFNNQKGSHNLIAFLSDDKKVTYDDLRKIIGYDKIKSANVIVHVNKDEVQFSGKGFGHGVGLCQWGSKYLAEKGFHFDQILKHYYPKVKIIKSEIVSINKLKPAFKSL